MCCFNEASLLVGDVDLENSELQRFCLRLLLLLRLLESRRRLPPPSSRHHFLKVFTLLALHSSLVPMLLFTTPGPPERPNWTAGRLGRTPKTGAA